MSLWNWIWVYLATGESFARWAALLFYGALWGVALVAVGLVAILAMAMAIYG